MSLEPRGRLRPELVGSWGEICGVLLVLLGPFIVMSTLASAHTVHANYMQVFLSDRALLLNMAAEAAILGLGLIYFRWRGWTVADLRIRPGFVSSVEGVIITPLTVVTNAFTVFSLFALVFLAQTRYPTFIQFVLANNVSLKSVHVGGVSWVVLIPAMILNAFLEEIICTSYMFRQFQAKGGVPFALALTVLLRMACHTYQGPVHALGIGTVFLIYGLWYWQRRNVWTLIFAHALLDIGMISIVKLILS